MKYQALEQRVFVSIAVRIFDVGFSFNKSSMLCVRALTSNVTHSLSRRWLQKAVSAAWERAMRVQHLYTVWERAMHVQSLYTIPFSLWNSKAFRPSWHLLRLPAFLHALSSIHWIQQRQSFRFRHGRSIWKAMSQAGVSVL